MARGAVFNVAAQAVLFPTGFVVAAYLSRRLGPVDYGTLAVVASLVLWIETVLPSIFSPAIVTLVAQRTEWQGAAAGVARVQLAVALALCGLVLAGAPLVASTMRAPELAGYLRLLAVDIPLSQFFCLNVAVLQATEVYGRATVSGVSYYVGRMVFVVLFVAVMPSAWSAVAAFLCAGVVRVLVSRAFVRVPIVRVAGFPLRHVLSYSGAGLSLAIIAPVFDQVGLYFVKAMDPDHATAGFYSAAANIAVVPTVFAIALGSVMLTSITKELGAGAMEGARVLVRQSARMLLLLLPFAGLISGCSREIVTLIYGQRFEPAAPLFVILSFATAIWAVTTSCHAPLLAARKLRWLPWLYGPLLPILVASCYRLTAQLGGSGAALATLMTGTVGACVGGAMIFRVYGAVVPARTLAATLAITLALFAIGRLWLAPGLTIIIKMGSLGLLATALLVVSRNIGQGDLDFARSLLPVPLKRPFLPGNGN